MTLNVSGSGPISLGGKTTGQSVELELKSTYGTGGFATISMNDRAARTLAQKSSGIIKMSDFYGKSASVSLSRTISSNTSNYDLRADAISLGWDGTTPLIFTVTINAGITVQSINTNSYAFYISPNFPAGSTLTVNNNGTIIGCGGAGGAGGVGTTIDTGTNGSAGSPGGPALYVGYNVSIYNLSLIHI